METGSKVPDFLGRDQDGKEIRRTDYDGETIILYFYPKDDTSLCTLQACNLRDNYADLLQSGYRVIGVSKDSSASHRRFREKYDLPFPLIADPEKHLLETFGVLKEKSMYGRKYMGTERTTFIISPEGIITRVLRGKEVDAKEHSRQIIK